MSSWVFMVHEGQEDSLVPGGWQLTTALLQGAASPEGPIGSCLMYMWRWQCQGIFLSFHEPAPAQWQTTPKTPQLRFSFSKCLAQGTAGSSQRQKRRLEHKLFHHAPCQWDITKPPFKAALEHPDHLMSELQRPAHAFDSFAHRHCRWIQVGIINSVLRAEFE